MGNKVFPPLSDLYKYINNVHIHMGNCKQICLSEKERKKARKLPIDRQKDRTVHRMIDRTIEQIINIMIAS